MLMRYSQLSPFHSSRSYCTLTLSCFLLAPMSWGAVAFGQTNEMTVEEQQHKPPSVAPASDTLLNEAEATQSISSTKPSESNADPAGQAALQAPPAATSEFPLEVVAPESPAAMLPQPESVVATPDPVVTTPEPVAPPAPAPAVATAGDKPVQPYNVPIVMDSKVEGHIRFFNSTIHDKFEKWLLRLSHYHPVVERIFVEFGLPTDLVYLSLVESGFNPHAYSRARATGPWQFMKGTGKLYGLRVDKYVDERRDPIKSTVAAARYLRDLYDLFGSWPLAMAAYNAGEGKVMRALHKSQSESFAEIAETRLIRRETKEYVPRFMAATVIAKNPARYGFHVGEVDPHAFEEVTVGRSIHLRAIANASGVEFESLRMLNPELRLEATPPDDAHYHLKVPVGTKAKIEKVLDRVPNWKAPPSPPARSVKVKLNRSTQHKWYRVRGGDTLASVAKRFNVSISLLKERNNISARQLRRGELLSIH